MKKGLFLITGTSRGIGEAIARKLLAEKHTVLGISRSVPRSLSSSDYHHLSFDLIDTDQLGKIIEKLDVIYASQSYEFICLINNASATEPVGPIDQCPVTLIDSHVRIGLIAPMILTSNFIRKFNNLKIRKKVVFISSGAAFNAWQDESVYCGTKAGAHMFVQCVGLEQADRKNGVEVILIGPGMVDTPMQDVIRSKSSEEFAMVDFFKEAHEDGKLKDPDNVAEKIYTILNNKYEQGQYVSVYTL